METTTEKKSVWKWYLAAVLLVLGLLWALVIYWSAEPELFDVRKVAREQAGLEEGQPLVTGVVTTATLIEEVETLLNKRGGFLSNDVTPPSIFMDNMPSWEYGVIIQVRDMTRAIRDRMSRSQSQSKEDEDLSYAEPRLNIDNTSWAFPDAQSEYEDGAEYLESYMQRLLDKDEADGQFYARADNLSYWLSIVEIRLGSLSQRLSASVGQKRINTDLAGETGAVQSTVVDEEVLVKTPWLEIDDVFYEARGTAWALIHLLKAVEVDFAEVLKKKNAQTSLAQIIRELEATQESLLSPMVLNGSGFGLWANHSLVMASYLSRANAAIIDLRALLENG